MNGPNYANQEHECSPRSRSWLNGALQKLADKAVAAAQGENYPEALIALAEFKGTLMGAGFMPRSSFFSFQAAITTCVEDDEIFRAAADFRRDNK